MGEVLRIRNGKVMDITRTEKSMVFENLIRRIDSLNRMTEEDFLVIGRDLQEVSGGSCEISNNALAASTVMSGDEIRGSIEGLGEMVHQLEEIFSRTDESSSRNVDLLLFIANTLCTVKRELTVLRETSRDLKMLSLSTRIQSTRTGDNSTAFMQLGQDIKKMSEVISSKASDLTGETASLGALVNKVRQNLNELRSSHRLLTQNVAKGTWNIIDGLNYLSDKSGEEVERIKGSSKAITGSIDELVVSVQYQDITRQSLERVMGELRNAQKGGLREYMTDAGRSGKGQTTSEDVLLVGLCRKQTKCLMETGENIAAAVENMLRNLQAVTFNIENMADVAQKASEESSQFLEELENEISSVTHFLSEVAASRKEMSSAMNSLAITVDGMAEFTGDIEMISSEVELIALNTRIMAVQNGSVGAGMSVIAEAVQETAHKSEVKRLSLINTLESVFKTSMQLKGQIDRDSTGDGIRFDHLVRELGVFLDALKIMQRKIVAMLDDIDLKSRDLREKISSALEKIEIQKKIHAEVLAISLELERTAREICLSIDSEDLHRIADGKMDRESLEDLNPGQIMALIKDHLSGTNFFQCFGEGRMASAEEEIILF